jgi:hypothetical protein
VVVVFYFVLYTIYVVDIRRTLTRAKNAPFRPSSSPHAAFRASKTDGKRCAASAATMATARHSLQPHLLQPRYKYGRNPRSKLLSCSRVTTKVLCHPTGSRKQLSTSRERACAGSSATQCVARGARRWDISGGWLAATPSKPVPTTAYTAFPLSGSSGV